MPVIKTESRRQATARILTEGGYDWAAGASLTMKPDADEAAENERRMVRRYRDWAASSLITYTPGKFESASHLYKDMPFETVNPINDAIKLPTPYYDEKLKKRVVPKNVFDRNVISRRRFLFEIDGMALDDQRKLLEPLLKERIIQRVVFSGNKSLHCVIEEADEPEASPHDETYKWLWRFMAYKYFKDMRFKDYSLPMKIDGSWEEVVDNRCGHPSRTTRSPFAIRKDETTGFKPVEQKLLYFENVRADSEWRLVYGQVKAYEAENRERMRRRAQHNAFKYRDREKKIPNEAARRFMGGDMSDGWKHANLGSAVASLKACGYGREEVAVIFEPYKKELQVFAMRSFDYFSRRDGR
jgi:hypothetical protein